MSNGPRYKNELDGLLSQAVTNLERSTMTTRDIIENAQGLINVAKTTTIFTAPYRLIVPVGTNLLELVGEEGSKKTLCDALLELENVKDVKVSEDSTGLSIENV